MSFRIAYGLVLALAGTAALPACGGEVVPVGRTDQRLGDADAGPKADGTTCTAADKTYRVGQSYFDGCNTITCTERGFSTTFVYCPPPGGATCTYEGKTYAEGATITPSVGGNTCTCTGGSVLCTRKACTCTGSDGASHADGESWQEVCNSCNCQSGQVQCTAMACN